MHAADGDNIKEKNYPCCNTATTLPAELQMNIDLSQGCTTFSLLLAAKHPINSLTAATS